jgi:hypothetical protein
MEAMTRERVEARVGAITGEWANVILIAGVMPVRMRAGATL